MLIESLQQDRTVRRVPRNRRERASLLLATYLVPDSDLFTTKIHLGSTELLGPPLRIGIPL